MENRERRLFNRVGHRVPRALRVVCAAVLSFGLLNDGLASDCDSNMAGEPAAYQTILQVHGQAPVRQSIPLLAPSEYMIFARERGVDITLEVTETAGSVIGRADNPIRRTGVQRVELPARAGQRYYAVVTGKDHGDSNGSVELRVVDLHRGVNAKCLGAQRVLAKADTAYAAGQSVTRAVGNTSGLNSDRAYQDAASGYRDAAAELLTAGASPLLAQAQLAEAAILNLDVDSFVEAKAGQDGRPKRTLLWAIPMARRARRRWEPQPPWTSQLPSKGPPPATPRSKRPQYWRTRAPSSMPHPPTMPAVGSFTSKPGRKTTSALPSITRAI